MPLDMPTYSIRSTQIGWLRFSAPSSYARRSQLHLYRCCRDWAGCTWFRADGLGFRSDSLRHHT